MSKLRSPRGKRHARQSARLPHPRCPDGARNAMMFTPESLQISNRSPRFDHPVVFGPICPNSLIVLLLLCAKEGSDHGGRFSICGISPDRLRVCYGDIKDSSYSEPVRGFFHCQFPGSGLENCYCRTIILNRPCSRCRKDCARVCLGSGNCGGRLRLNLNTELDQQAKRNTSRTPWRFTCLSSWQ